MLLGSSVYDFGSERKIINSLFPPPSQNKNTGHKLDSILWEEDQIGTLFEKRIT